MGTGPSRNDFFREAHFYCLLKARAVTNADVTALTTRPAEDTPTEPSRFQRRLSNALRKTPRWFDVEWFGDSTCATVYPGHTVTYWMWYAGGPNVSARGVKAC